jgi:hypothetical protein
MKPSAKTSKLYSLISNAVAKLRSKELFISYLLLVSTAALCQTATTTPQVDTISAPKKAVSTDSVISVKNLNTLKDSAKINEVIAVKVYTTKNIDSLGTLYLDGIAVKGLSSWKSNDNEKIIYFQLDRNVQDLLLKFLKSDPFEKSVLPVYFSVGDKDKSIAKSTVKMYIEVRQRIPSFWIYIIAIAIVVLVTYSLYKNILKDDNNLYYSLGRTQLFYWTILVIVAYLHISSVTNALPDIPLSILAIIGISVTTTAITKVVENKTKSGIPIDKDAKSEGWLVDILSDGSSINIQRFQNVAFNLFFGVIFLQKAITNHLMPDFDSNVLLLLGISSGTYAGLKMTEVTKGQNMPPKQVGTDIAEPEKPVVPDAATQAADDKAGDSTKAPADK